MDLRELMPDNAALSKMLSEVGAVSAMQAGSKVREIEDPSLGPSIFGCPGSFSGGPQGESDGSVRAAHHSSFSEAWWEGLVGLQ